MTMDSNMKKSLYIFDSNKSGIQVLESQLAKAEELSIPLLYYEVGKPYNPFKIAYISDIHLKHHLKYYDNSAKRMVRDISGKLFKSKRNADIVLFGGDITSNPDVAIMFFTQFKRKYDYDNYKCFKNKLNRLKRIKKEISLDSVSKYVKCRDNLAKYIEKRKEDLKSLFDFTVFEKYKARYYPDIAFEKAYENFKNTKGFKKYDVSEQVEVQILDIVSLIKMRKRYEYKIAEHERTLEKEQLEIEEFEREYSKSIEEISLNDYKHILLKDVYFVLGNHEYIEFSDIQTCVDFYKRELSKLGITLLQNEYVENDKFLLYGGTGFAKYDEVWNAKKVVCCPNFSREDEIKETTLFENGYREALEYAKGKGLCFLCVSHYPVSACLNNVYDRETIYFTGHNHRNEYVRTTDKVLYADNQVGYENNDIFFRIAATGFIINPYGGLNDGLYQTTVEEYLQFYRYLGESIGEGKLLYKRCENGDADFYVVKRRGYYGFFIISAQGISIVNGGKTKKITGSTDIAWICENFDIVVAKYLELLLPMRKVQEELSKELKELGFYGIIHGLIVDIDFNHHIAVNPLDGSMEYYYSSMWGRKMSLNSFDEVITSLELNRSLDDKRDYSVIKAKYAEKIKDKGYLLGIQTDSYLLETEDHEVEEISRRVEQIVSRTKGMYRVSRKINPLQRLFTGRVLREFDVKLTETKQQPYRKRLYINQIFLYEDNEYQVIKDDGSDIIQAVEIQYDFRAKGNEIRRTDNILEISITELLSKINNSKDMTCWLN